MTSRPPRLAKTVLALSISLFAAHAPAFAKTPVATGTGGAVATISDQASRAAVSILTKGGTAVDAAVAAAATLGVTDPFSCGIGGITVHVGARIAAAADEGEILVSSSVRDLVSGSGFSFRDRGGHLLKGLEEERRLYAIEA